MHLSHVHALYMAAQRLPGALAATIARPNIDACVNAHAATQDARRALPVTLTLPAAAGRRRAQLQRIASEPSIGGRRSRDAANAVKWLRRLECADALAWWLGRAGLTGDALAAYDRAPSWSRWWTERPLYGGKLADCLNQSRNVKFHDAESQEISEQPYQRDFRAAMENAPTPLVLVIKPFSARRYRKG